MLIWIFKQKKWRKQRPQPRRYRPNHASGSTRGSSRDAYLSTTLMLLWKPPVINVLLTAMSPARRRHVQTTASQTFRAECFQIIPGEKRKERVDAPRVWQTESKQKRARWASSAGLGWTRPHAPLRHHFHTWYANYQPHYGEGLALWKLTKQRTLIFIRLSFAVVGFAVTFFFFVMSLYLFVFANQRIIIFENQYGRIRTTSHVD